MKILTEDGSYQIRLSSGFANILFLFALLAALHSFGAVIFSLNPEVSKLPGVGWAALGELFQGALFLALAVFCLLSGHGSTRPALLDVDVVEYLEEEDDNATDSQALDHIMTKKS